MPLTPWALEKRERVAAAYRWVRQHLVLIIFAAMLVLQFMTWRATERVAHALPRDPPRCGTYDPCAVELTTYTINRLTQK